MANIKNVCEIWNAKQPIIWVNTFEERRFISELFESDIIGTKSDEDLVSIINPNKKVFLWSATQGMVELKNNNHLNYDILKTSDPQTLNLVIAIDKFAHDIKLIPEKNESAILILRDYHIPSKNHPHVRKLRDLYKYLALSNKTVFLIGPSNEIPNELQKEIGYLEYEYPTSEQIEEMFNTIIKGAMSEGVPDRKNPNYHIYTKNNKQHKIKTNYTKDETKQIIRSAQGLTKTEITIAISKCITNSKDGEIDYLKIAEEKKNIIKRSQVLEICTNLEPMEDVGGNEILKQWLIERNHAVTGKASEFGVRQPKGVILAGVQGAGKSMLAKAIASLYKLPLVRLDMGKIFAGLVGSSEKNMRDMIAQIESLAPCVLFCDEIEKGLSGTGSSNFSVSGNESIYYLNNKNEINYILMKNLHKLIKNGEKVSVLSLNKNSMKAEWKSVLRSLKHKDNRNLVKIKTSSSRNVISSIDHSFITCDIDGNIIPIKADNLMGKMVPILYNFITPTRDDNFENIGKFNTKKTVHKAGEFELNRTFGRIIGLWLSEGSITEDSVCFACTDIIVRKFIKDAFNELWPNRHIIETSVSIIISSKPLSSWFINGGKFKCGARNKNMPNFILTAPKEFRLGVLEGAIAGDGAISIHKSNSIDVTLCTTSKELREGYAMLTASLGKRVSFIESSQSIRICNWHTSDLIIPHSLKATRMNKFTLGEKTHSLLDRVPVPLNLVKQLKLEKNNSEHEILRTKAYRGRMSSINLIKKLNLIENCEAKIRLKNIAESDFRWDIVENIQEVPPEEYIYDLEVKDNNNFVLGNGLTVHNSDGGTSSRVFGTFISWMQDKIKPVFVVATANNLDQLPPELLRKGRFDAIWFIDLPSKEERKEIFKIHLQRIKPISRDPKLFDLDLLSNIRYEKNNEYYDYSGAEIEEAINDALFAKYSKNLIENINETDIIPGSKYDITTDDIVEAMSNTIPISCTAEDKINKIRKWGQKHARLASAYNINSKTEIKTKKKKDKFDINSIL